MIASLRSAAKWLRFVLFKVRVWWFLNGPRLARRLGLGFTAANAGAFLRGFGWALGGPWGAAEVSCAIYAVLVTWYASLQGFEEEIGWTPLEEFLDELADDMQKAFR